MTETAGAKPRAWATMSLLALLVGAMSWQSVILLHRPRNDAREVLLAQGDGEGSSTDLSIGELIDTSELVVRGAPIEVKAPGWNSADRTNWSDEWEEDPSAFAMSPKIYTSVLFRIDEVLEGEGAAAGDALEVYYLGAPGLLPLSVELSDDPSVALKTLGSSVLFAARHRLSLAGPAGDRRKAGEVSVWQSPELYGEWVVDESGLIYPESFEQSFSLGAGAGVDGLSVERIGRRWAITIETLREIITRERETPTEASFASFARWPWEPGWQAETEADLAASVPPPD